MVFFGSPNLKEASLLERPFSISLITLHLIAKGFTFNFCLGILSAEYLVTARISFLKFQTDRNHTDKYSKFNRTFYL